MPKKRTNSHGRWHVLAILAGILGFLGLLGELEMTVIGRLIYAFLKNIFGSLAWVIPLFCLFLAIGIEIRLRSKGKKKYSRKNDQRIKGKTQDQKTNKLTHTHDQVKTGIPLPKGKLVGLQGFEEYFASTEGPEIKTAEPAAAEDLSELGNDFSTYFQEGHKFSFKPLETKIVTLKGFNSYFDSVQTECEEELKEEHKEASHFQAKLPEKGEWISVLKKEPETLVPGQLAHLVQSQSIPVLHSMHGITSAETTGPLNSEEERTSLKEANDNSDNLSFNNTGSNEVEDKEDKGDKIEETISFEKEVDENNIEKADIKLQEMRPESKAQELNPKQTCTSSEIVTKTQEEGFKVPLPDQPKTWVLPSFELLDPIPDIPVVHDTDTQKKLEQVLADFGVQAKVVRVTRGPVITRFELAPAPGVKISRIVHLADDIALGLAARDVRIEAPIPGKAAIGIEVPNKHPRPVPFREVLETQPFQENPSKLKTALGKDISNQPVIADLKKMPHILIAGATGSGKSVCITSLINSILFNARPEEVKFLMVDPKMVELSIYNGIPHLLAPVVTDPKKAAAALKWIVKEMETRYELFAAAGVRDIERYNRQKNAETDHKSSILPWIVVIIDELADLMMVAANEVEEAICRLAQMARAAGIHLVIATQRPSVDVITGVIKANIPSRVSFAVSSQIDSRTILDATGAEKLLGKGDMLYSPQGLNKPMRVQGCFVSDDEVQRVISYWKSQGKPEYLDPEGFLAETETKVESSGFEDELFIDAGRLIMNTGMASVSFLQRKLKLGYARAARLIDLLEENGVVGGYEGSKPRQILMTMEEFEERFS
ncbi:DNA translocase FtsK [Desulfitobacterium sp. AusDCA]|uniref:DNA translocase FtsK n=1 Tax=Desulfitobacterium sp. AusDCA TaxID=3240383 RepID=UPI003DA76555